MRRKLLGISICLGLLSVFVLPAFAGSWTKYPPYSGGYGSTDGGLTGLGMWCPAYYVDPSIGRINVLAAAEGFLGGYGWAKATGWITQWWPRAPGGGGGCPFAYAWDGNQYKLDNNLMPSSELSARSEGADVEDYYKLEQNLVRKNGKESVLIGEFEEEHSYIDKIGLFAVDHDPDVNIAITQEGEILTYRNPISPLSANDKTGRNRLREIESKDGNVLDSVTFFEGFPGDYLVLNFGKVDSENAKLILRTDMKKQFECIMVQVLSIAGSWQTIEVLVPRCYWSDQAVNLSPYVIKGQELLVRLFWKWHHRLDYVGLDTTRQEKYEIHDGNMVQAVHSTQGNVKALLAENDDKRVELVSGEQIQLDFTLPRNTKEARTHVLYLKGHYVHENPSESAEKIEKSGTDPIVSLDSKIRMDGQVTMWVVGIPGFTANWATFSLKILLWIFDDTVGTYVTQTVLKEWGAEIWFEGAYSYTWNFDQDVHTTFNADLSHRYEIMIGLEALARGFTIGAGDAYVNIDLYNSPYGTIVQYIYLSWT